MPTPSPLAEVEAKDRIAWCFAHRIETRISGGFRTEELQILPEILPDPRFAEHLLRERFRHLA
jgi:hypothetical protein